MVIDRETTSREARSRAVGAYRFMNRSPSLFTKNPPSPRDPSVIKHPAPYTPLYLKKKGLHVQLDETAQTPYLDSGFRHDLPSTPISMINNMAYRISISGAGVGGCTAKVGTSKSTSREHRLVRSKSMNRSIFHIEGNDATTRAILHDQIQGKVLDKVGCVKLQRCAIQGVEDGMARAISDRGASMCLAALAEI